MKNEKRIIITKDDCLTDFEPGPWLPGGNELSVIDFDRLADFALNNRFQIMQYMDYEEGKHMLFPDDYVGVIALKDGTQIEIIPRIDQGDGRDWNINDAKWKILNMLDTMNDVPLKEVNKRYYARENLNLFEICVRMFTEEVQGILFSCLKQAYVPYRDNEMFVKGKTVYSIHARKNFAHKERFYVEYDVFSVNRAENRLILSALVLLSKLSANARNLKKIKAVIPAFDGVPMSERIDLDFSLCVLDRSMGKYLSAISWAKMFLLNKGGTFFAGGKVKYAMLFPVNKLFSGYIAAKLREGLDHARYEITEPEYITNTLNNARRAGEVTDSIEIRSKDGSTKIRFVFDDVDDFFDPLEENEIALFPMTEIINAGERVLKDNFYLMDMNKIDESVAKLISARFS
ncbi:MAG: McrC family protein [Ruminococcus sp.]|jgi:5-methylcytosine-specific restriction enzyme subunit McrC|nr:McrC family protein [Ruminococcus sp.]